MKIIELIEKLEVIAASNPDAAIKLYNHDDCDFADATKVEFHPELNEAHLA
jgi:hypothetical protein